MQKKNRLSFVARNTKNIQARIFCQFFKKPSDFMNASFFRLILIELLRKNINFFNHLKMMSIPRKKTAGLV